jgi:hypothetical protein
MTTQAEALIALAKTPGVRSVFVAKDIWLAVFAALCDEPSAVPVDDGAEAWLVDGVLVEVDDSIPTGDWYVVRRSS